MRACLSITSDCDDDEPAEHRMRLFVNSDDPIGPTALGIFTTFASLVIATAAALFERPLQNAVNIKSENDLTA